ncbi:TM1802 family CRISPR-associated protein [Wolinella succinogenes]|uniref:TM1802 family CRISPR-associated protein n=1 Tax=Wolinella succinogenes TaxID=844 RepID=UPI002FCB1B34
MGDIVKAFYEVGGVYQEEAIDNYNQIGVKNIQKIIALDLDGYDVQVYDTVAISDRFFLRVTSANGGNLFPFLFLSDKVLDGIKKSFKNMKAFLSIEKQWELESIEKAIDCDLLSEKLKEFQSEKNYYIGLLYQGRTFNEIYPEVITNYIASACEGDVAIKASCFMGGESTVGYDAGLNFCSVNELPDKLKKTSKYRLLPLAKEGATLVKQGFEKIFNEEIFRFRLFGLSYYFVPTIFLDDKKSFIEAIKKASKESDVGIDGGKYTLERKLERIVQKLEDAQISQKMLFTFMFAEKNNNEIKLLQTIEDVAPSRIKKVKELAEEYRIDTSNLSKYIKKAEYNQDAVYIRDYIAESLFLAKLIFGKEGIANIDKLYEIINKKIMLGNNQPDNPKREYAKILSGYFKDDTDFEKHQRFLDFLEALRAVNFEAKNLIHGGEMEEFASFKELMEWKFKNVDVLKSAIAQEFYIVGALSRFVIRWQYTKESDTVAKYLDSIGSINNQNIDRVFRKVMDGAKKYSMYGDEFDMLLGAYSDIQSEVKNRVISIDKANIAFTMGSIDYKNFKSKKGEEQ